MTREWTPEEDRLLIKMMLEEKPIQEISKAVRHYSTICRARYTRLTANKTGGKQARMCAYCESYNGNDREKAKNGSWLSKCEKKQAYIHRCDFACEEYKRAKKVVTL